MVSVISSGDGAWDIRGLAAEKEAYTQTNDIPNGSTYYEIDGQHRVFMLDKENGLWIEQ